MECRDPTPLLEFLQGNSSERKLRLFAVACCRSAWHLFEERDQKAIGTSELFADGMATEYELIAASKWTTWSMMVAARESLKTVIVAKSLARQAGRIAAMEVGTTRGRLAAGAAAARQSITLRDIFANPFRPISINPHWIPPTVTSIGTAAYEERIMPSGELDQDRLAVLSDAVEEAGCDSPDILDHLRSPEPHVRGCWALDHILGKR